VSFDRRSIRVISRSATASARFANLAARASSGLEALGALAGDDALRRCEGEREGLEAAESALGRGVSGGLLGHASVEDGGGDGGCLLV
jgi:hypothetical protein